ncbi:MAG: acetate/propionate family kinase [Xanthomonadales bacterium]|nr:acetate/propionate family kinase [Xanthomonadales bacterium]ODU94454.1 MAG: acetate kinase [Rhodanobacter sp. SCN 66-43]OJY87062.1 MAG: acetate kinase [Xanthomonadales bacterium 66-474]
MNAAILSLNIGSSSIKLALFDAVTLEPILRGNVTDVGRDARASFTSHGQTTVSERPAAADIGEAVRWLLAEVRERHPEMRLAAVGHRVVHGGTRFDKPVRVDAEVLAELEALAVLAPAHQPAEIALIRNLQELLPDVPQIACFDTAFHRTQPKLSQWFALPRALSESGIVRIGFHGLSYEYIASVLPQIAVPHPYGKTVVAHLGHGASVCAMRNLRSVSTSMGFTPLDGLMMGTRCGTIDPGVLLHLQQQRGMSAQDVADLLGNRSGLLGVSGISDDVRVLEASGDPRAREALEMFAERAATAIAAQCVALEGLDALVFTGGIGEHAENTRKRIGERLRWLGIVLDDARNASDATRISSDAARVQVFVIPTDEETVIARAAARLLGSPSER